MSKPYPVTDFGRLDMRTWASLRCPDIHIHAGLEFDRGWDLLIHELLTVIAKVLADENRMLASIGDVSVRVGRIKGDRVPLVFSRPVSAAELQSVVDTIMARENRLSIKADRVNGKSAVLRITKGAKKLKYHEVDELQQGLPHVIGIGLSRIRRGRRFNANSPVVLGMNGGRFLNIRVSKSHNLFDLMKAVADCLAVKRSSVYVSQVKEKFATLRFYWSGENLSEEAHDRINSAISRADAKSAVTCELSGGIGRLYNVGGTWRTRAPEFEQGESPAYPFDRPAFMGRSSRSGEKVYRYNVMDAGWPEHHVAVEERFSYEGHERLADGLVSESDEFMRFVLAVLPVRDVALRRGFARRGREFPADTLLAKFTDNRNFQKIDPVTHLLESLKNDKKDLRGACRMADAEIRIERQDGKVREIAVLKSGGHEGEIFRVREYGEDWADVVDYLDAEPLGRVADDILCSIDRAFYACVGGQLSAEKLKTVKLGKPGFDVSPPLWKLAGRLRLVIQRLGRKEALEIVPQFSDTFRSGFFATAEEAAPRIVPLFETYSRETKKLRKRLWLRQFSRMRLPVDRHAVVQMRNRSVVATAVRKANHVGVKLPSLGRWKPSAFTKMQTHRTAFVTTTYANARSHVLDEAMPQVVACATAFVEAVEAAARKREIERPFSVPVSPDPVELAKFEGSKVAFFAAYGITTGEEYMALKDMASKLFRQGYDLERALDSLKTPEGKALAKEANKLAMEAGGFEWRPIPDAAVRLREIAADLERLQSRFPL